MGDLSWIVVGDIVMGAIVGIEMEGAKVLELLIFFELFDDLDPGSLHLLGTVDVLDPFELFELFAEVDAGPHDGTELWGMYVGLEVPGVILG